MELLCIVWTSLLSLVVLFLLAKLIGCRQMSEMSMFDYISGITIGSIAAEAALAEVGEFTRPLTAMAAYGLATAFLAWVTGKNRRLRRFISGTPYLLLENGILYEENFKKGHIDLSEFLVQCRVNGYFDLSSLECAILEENGRISFLPKSTDRPATPSDFDIEPSKEVLPPTYIMDGEILWENLQKSGKNETWLLGQVHAHGCDSVSEVFLATGNQENLLNVYPKNHQGGSGVIKE